MSEIVFLFRLAGKKIKKEKMKQLHIFVIHDGIENSVFPGQVLQPLRNKLSRNPELKIILISFESTQTPLENLNLPDRLRLIILKKNIFLGRLSLYPAIWQLKKVFQKHRNFTVTARGPIAGYVCLKALKPCPARSLMVQARGLLEQEYAFAHPKTKNILKNLAHALRTLQYKNVEKKVYGKKNIQIEAVSPALSTFLQNEFGAKSQQITIAQKDIPKKIQPAQIALWKKEIRKKLNIPTHSCTYCFNGSVKPWQCPQKVISFFKQKLAEKPNVFLLVLTQQKKEFEQLLNKNNISEKNYVVLTVTHKEIYKYLAACDIGLIFREPHVVNWVSRPTKILEYQAVGLEVIHNGTVQWITDTPLKSHKTTEKDFLNDF